MAHSVRENVSPALVLAIIALFCSIGGVALAVKKAPKNSVVKKSIKNNAVTGVKIADGQVGTADLADQSVTAAKLAPGAIPQLSIEPGSITGAMIGDGEVKSADIGDGQVSSADLAGGLLDNTAVTSIGRQGDFGTCDPQNLAGDNCGFVEITLNRPGRLLIESHGKRSSGGGIGGCVIQIPGEPFVPGQMGLQFDSTVPQGITVSASMVTPVMTPSDYEVDLDCFQGLADFKLSQTSISVVTLGAG